MHQGAFYVFADTSRWTGDAYAYLRLLPCVLPVDIASNGQVILGPAD